MANSKCARCTAMKKGCGENCFLLPHFPSGALEEYNSFKKHFGTHVQANKYLNCLNTAKRNAVVDHLKQVRRTGWDEEEFSDEVRKRLIDYFGNMENALMFMKGMSAEAVKGLVGNLREPVLVEDLGAPVQQKPPVSPRRLRSRVKPPPATRMVDLFVAVDNVLRRVKRYETEIKSQAQEVEYLRKDVENLRKLIGDAFDGGEERRSSSEDTRTGSSPSRSGAGPSVQPTSSVEQAASVLGGLRRRTHKGKEPV